MGYYAQKPTAAFGQVEALRKTVCNVQAELEKAISAMGLRVKFELLHDEMPQVCATSLFFLIN
jgi:hypothetical protein